MKILIVGAGISGLTLASFLRQREGFDVDIIDKAKDWSHLGYTIGIWDIGRRILAKLDLDNEFDKLSHPIHSYYITDKSSSKIIKLDHFEEFYKKYESAYSHINRKDLHEILFQKMGGNVRMGLSPESIKEYDRKVEVTFNDGTTDNYDLVVGADGIHSKVREIIYPEDKIKYTGDRGWYAWIPQKYVPSQTIMEITGGRSMCSLFDNPNQACVFFTAPEQPGTFCDPKTRLERIKKHFKNFGTPVTEILSELKGEDLMPTDIGFVKSTNWIKGNVVLIGDAAHAMEPFAGIGSSMAMEDAYVLQDELAQLSSTEIRKALSRYMQRRALRVDTARRQTRLNYILDISGFNMIKRIFAPLIPIKHFTYGYKKLLETEP